MKIKLVPKSIKNLFELSTWMHENILDTDTCIGIRRDCKITKLREFSYQGPRYNMYGGVPLYFNF